MESAGAAAHGQLQSPFSHLLSSNTAPSDVECEAIRQFLSGLQRNFAALTEEISRMQSVLSDLADQCERLRESIDTHRALVSLARRLPEDVIREIFLACLPSWRNAVMSSGEAPLLLGQVCSSWRKIAFSTPQLWTALHVVVPNASRLRLMSGAVEAWLTRSGTFPLSLTLAVSKACEPGSDNIATMIDVLANFSRRWKRVKITLSPRTILTPLTNLHPSDVPILESIALTSIGTGSWQNVVTALDIPWRRFKFFQSPSIRTVSLASLGGNLLALSLPWPLLRFLSLTAGNVKDSNSFELPTTTALLILRQCPNLTMCRLCITPERDPVADDPEAPAIKLAHLVDFTVDNREYSQNNILSLFQPLRGHLPFISLFSAIHALESLSIDVSDLSMNAFSHCVELLPSLMQLKLESGDPWTSTNAQWGRENPLATPNDILRALTPDPRVSHECPCPALRRLTIVRCQPLADDVLLNFIQLRKEAEHPIARVDVAFVRQKEFDILPHLKELIADGLRVSLKYLPAPVMPTYSPWEGLDA
ncbi:hypothetical protein B0H11DRAFT_1997069 [Mycena galericulata]|nr:hypothetical protein B0H11DRAFT_1997069 [Mycena galericulata]